MVRVVVIAVLIWMLFRCYMSRHMVRLILSYRVHQLVYNFPSWPVKDLQRDGVLAAARKHRLVPVGFEASTKWTSDMPCTVPECRGYSKHDAAPERVLDVLMPHDATLRRRVGSSIFIRDDRSGDRKERYLQALRQPAMDRVPSVVQTALQKKRTHSTTLSAWALDVATEVTWVLHSGNEDAQAIADTLHMTMCVTKTLNDPYGRTYFAEKAKARLRSACAIAEDGFFKDWRNAGMTDDDAFVEFAHNLVGMTVQWAFLLVRLCRAADRPTTHIEAMAFVLQRPPTSVAASRQRCPYSHLVLHDLASACATTTAPTEDQVNTQGSINEKWGTRTTPGGAVVVAEHGICEKPGYVPFGCGPRRCPGEWLTYEFIVAAAPGPWPRVKDAQHSVFMGLQKVLEATVQTLPRTHARI